VQDHPGLFAGESQKRFFPVHPKLPQVLGHDMAALIIYIESGGESQVYFEFGIDIGEDTQRRAVVKGMIYPIFPCMQIDAAIKFALLYVNSLNCVQGRNGYSFSRCLHNRAGSAVGRHDTNC
jgi:hypothetical protein